MARLLTNRSPAYQQTDTQNRKFQRATRTSPTFSEIKFEAESAALLFLGLLLQKH